MKANFKIEGFGNIEKVLQKLPGAVVDKEVQTIMARQARKTMAVMRDQVGEHKGTLKKAMKIKRGKFKPKVIDIWGGVQNSRFSSAPHWHLVAEGTGLRKVDSYKTKIKTKLVPSKHGRGIVIPTNVGEVRFVYQTGKMPANPYATKAFAKTGAHVGVEQAKDIQRYLNRRASTLMKKYAIAKGRA